MDDPLTHSSHQERSGRRGFTLIEVMVILFFMVIAASIAVPRFASFQRSSQARDTARNLAALVREARQTAIEKQRPVVLDLDPNAHVAVLLYDDSLLPLTSSEATMTGQTGDGTESPRPPLFYPDTLLTELQLSQTSLDTNTSGRGLTFMPDGRAPDADILVASGPTQGLRVTVRRQATRVRIVSAADTDLDPLQP